MSTATTTQPTYDVFRKDRPGWIPEWVGDEWDPNPYAYQTEEQLMPAGHYPSHYLYLLAQLLDPLMGQMGLEFLGDMFLFYRDERDFKQRIVSDALIAPIFPELTEQQAACSYDLDVEPTPLFVLEIISSDSKKRDYVAKRALYAQLGIYECLVLDIFDSKGRLRNQIGVTLWQLFDGEYVDAPPDAEGYVMLQSIGIRLRAEGRRLVAQVIATGEFLRTSSELLAALDESEQARQEAEQRAVQAEAELTQLRAELARLRGVTGADAND